MQENSNSVMLKVNVGNVQLCYTSSGAVEDIT